MSGRRYHVILNPRAGGALALGLDAAALHERFAAAGLVAEVDDRGDVPMERRLREAVESSAEIVVAAGGDGTVTAVAEALVDTEKTLAILPLGTANLLARDAGIPLDLDGAIERLGAMAPLRIDAGEVNGQVFLHKVVIGTVPGIAAGRERLRGRSDLPAIVGFLRYFVRRLGRARRFTVEIETGSGPRSVRAQAVAVGNNAYDEGLARIFARTRLDRGLLSVYVFPRLRLAEAVRLSFGMLLGRWRGSPALTIEEVPSLAIRSRRKRLAVMLDGEIRTLQTPLAFRIRPGALTLLAPTPDGG